MKKANLHIVLLLTLIGIFVTMLSSCRSSFPATGTIVECNGQSLKPILNPTQRGEFPGGRQAMHQFLRANINLPKEVIERNIKGTVRVAFIVTKEGEICDVRITSKPKEYLDDAVIREVKKMPKWRPGIHEGKIVDSYFLIDIKF